MRLDRVLNPDLKTWWLIAMALIKASSSAALGERISLEMEARGSKLANVASFQGRKTNAVSHNITPSPANFPVCTDLKGPFAPFCLPEDGANVMVDASYYVTWNADFYPLNATITIEMRYANSAQGDSAYTSERTDNSYGYMPLHMQKEWLQGKPYNVLTLYIIELDPTSGSRASARQGPTVRLHPRPAEHYKPPPQIPFNKKALYVGLPVSLGVVIAVVAGLFFGMRRTRSIGPKGVGIRCKGYGIGKSKGQRIGNERSFRAADSLSAMSKYADGLDEDCSEFAGSEKYEGLDHSANFACRQEVSRLKTWSS